METKIDKCAPSKKFEDGSCFSLESLKLIANKYNEKNEKTKINISDNKKELVNKLKTIFSDYCNSQVCWLRTDLVKSLNNEEINEDTFRPAGPPKKYDWLSTTNINDVLSQYEELYPEFVFLGAVPNDFEELPVLGLSDINFDNFINDKKTKIGLVINLDTHKQSGSHWVALYTDLINNQIYYFDSVGKKPGKRIKKFNNKIFKYLYNKKNNKNIDVNDIFNVYSKKKKISSKYFKMLNNKLNKFDIRHNQIQHQQENSECGVYSINFILRIVKGETFDNIVQNITTDEEVNKCRKVYFRNV
jgi:hypothetical protein